MGVYYCYGYTHINPLTSPPMRGHVRGERREQHLQESHEVDTGTGSKFDDQSRIFLGL